MKVKVTELHDFDNFGVPVKVNGYCIHKNTIAELQYGGYYSFDAEDSVERSEHLEVCIDCDAWRYLYDLHWHDENIDDNYGLTFPTTGELVLR